MRGGMPLAILIALGGGFLFGLCGPHPEAKGSRQDRPLQWEYRIVKYSFPIFDGSTERADEQLSREYNALGREGWEYVGHVFPVAYEQPQRAFGASVLFKRLR